MKESSYSVLCGVEILWKLKSITSYKLLYWMLSHSVDNRIVISPAIRKEILCTLNITNNTYISVIRELKLHNLILGNNGVYTLNRDIFKTV